MALTTKSFQGDQAPDETLEGVAPKSLKVRGADDPPPWDFPLRDEPPFHVSGEN